MDNYSTAIDQSDQNNDESKFLHSFICRHS